MSIFDDLLTIAISAFVNNKFGYHLHTILQITSSLPLPRHRPFPRVGGTAPGVGLSIPSGDNSVLPGGVPLNFRHFGHKPLITGSKKNPSSLVYLILSPLPLVFNAKRALPYPFRSFLHFALTAKVEDVPAPEAFSRVLIDKELEYSGWNLLDSHQARFESLYMMGKQIIC